MTDASRIRAGERLTRLGYVPKVFPRVSETFVINELRALEELGENVLRLLAAPSPGARSRTRSSSAWLRRSHTWKIVVPDEEDGPARRRHLQRPLSASPTSSASVSCRASTCALPSPWPTSRASSTACATCTRTSRRGPGTSRLLASACMGCPYSMTAHAKDIYHRDVDRELLAWKIAQARFVVTVTDYNLAHLRTLLGRATRTPTRTRAPLQRRRPVALPSRPRPRPRADRCIVSIGRLVEKKGFGVLVDACALLRDARRSFRCEIIGGGELEASIRGRSSRSSGSTTS